MAVESKILLPGSTLGGYRIVDILGIGGMAVVYRAEQVSLRREVALKVLSVDLGRDESFRERFRREGMNVAALDHPNIIPIHDSGEVDGHLYLAMRLVDGMTLAERMRHEGMNADMTLAFLSPIADALDAAHVAGLVHRDIKPQNILLTASNHPYLADFGIAKATHGAGLTVTGGFVGTFHFAAPEQVQGRAVTRATDVYSLAAVLFQCLTGEVPYPRDTDAGVLHAHVTEPPPQISSAGPGSDAINMLFRRGMAKDPSERYPSASTLLSAARDAIAPLDDMRRNAVPTFTATASTGRASGEKIDTCATIFVDTYAAATAEGELSAASPVQVESDAIIESVLAVIVDAPPAPIPVDRPTDPSEDIASAEDTGIAVEADVLTADGTVIIPAVADDGPERPISGDKSAHGPRQPGPGAPSATVTAKRAIPTAWRVGVLAVCLCAITAVIVVGLASSDPSKKRPAIDTGRTPKRGNTKTVVESTARSGRLKLTYQASWMRTTTSVAGANVLQHPVLLTSGVVSAAAGPLVKSAPVPGGVPPELRASYGAPTSSVQTTVAGSAGKAYSWAERGQNLQAYIAPTQNGDFALICATTTATALATCDQLAAHVTLSNVTSMDPTVDAILARQVSHALGRVAERRASLGTFDGPTLSARASQAAAVAVADRKAAHTLSLLAPPKRYASRVAKLSQALFVEGAALTSLADDGNTAQYTDYTDQTARVRAASESVARAGKAFAGTGLGVPGLRVLTLAAAPSPPATSSGSTSTGATQGSEGTGPTESTPPAPLGKGGQFGAPSTTKVS